MILSELFARLSYGELSNLALSQEGSGTILVAKIPQLVRYTNEALLRLYSRFLLAEKSVIIEQVAHITTYELRPKNAERHVPPATYPFIKDLLGDAFEDDVIKILEAHDSFGREFFLNDATKENSLFTPFPNVLQVPKPIAGAALSILYQARHPILVDVVGPGLDDVLTQNVDIPFSLEGALQALIAAAVYSHMNGVENINKSREYLQNAEAISFEVEQKDLVSQSNATSAHKFHQRGFV